ncbi:hypothetical protein CDD81_1930 [Ophiocordyceps australis]|uniref:Uncharacterized protein n=1 Tax=Ophiocordyceps australis TaxID=1399860 RepID=A0A2C5XYM2_9HYPO|nr:hypothetical protein CDD81_1930 [Ophiocordyceps australis]
MTVPRASSGLLRSRIPIRPVTAAPRVSLSRGLKDDLGGPYGQEPPPKDPSSLAAARRNWIPITGAFVAAALGYIYFWRDSPKPKDVPTMARQEGEKMARGIEKKGSEALSEVSGRTNKSGTGSWRSE